mgnify:CR=1 FL=1
MRFHVVTLFPEMFEAMVGTGVTGRAFEQGRVELGLWNPRDYTSDVHRTVDDRPYGGGPGMVMKVEPLEAAIEEGAERIHGTALGIGERAGNAEIDQLLGHDRTTSRACRWHDAQVQLSTLHVFVDEKLERRAQVRLALRTPSTPERPELDVRKTRAGNRCLEQHDLAGADHAVSVADDQVTQSLPAPRCGTEGQRLIDHSVIE